MEQENQESIVAEPPPLTRRIMPLVFVGGVISGWYLWNRFMDGAPVSWNAWSLTGIALLCGPLWLLNGSRRVVMNPAFLSEYRGRKLLRRLPIREITTLQPETNATKVVFGNYGAITIPTMWSGAGDILHHLRSVADLHGASMPPMDDWLPLNYLSFPPRCVSCGSSDVIAHRIFAGTQYHLPNVHIIRGSEIPVPACSNCSRRRKVVGFLTAIALIALGIGLNFGAIVASDRVPDIHVGSINSFGVLFLTALTMLFVIIHLVNNQVPRWLDQRLLGVAALRLGKDKATVRLWFRDRQTEIDVRTRTAESRSRHMANATEMLRAPQASTPDSRIAS